MGIAPIACGSRANLTLAQLQWQQSPMTDGRSLQPKYRRRGWCAAAALILLIGVETTIYLLNPGNFDLMVKSGAIGCVIAGLLIWSMNHSLTELEKARWTDGLRELGFELLPTRTGFGINPSVELPADIELFFGHSMAKQRRGVHYLAGRVILEGRVTWLIRDEFVRTRNHQSRWCSDYLLLSRTTEWPLTTIRRSAFVPDAVESLLGKKAVELYDPLLRDRLTVTCEDADFANLIVSPELAQLILSADIWDELHFGWGGILVSAGSVLGTSKTRMVIEFAQQLEAAVPPELREWEPPSTPKF